MQPLRLHRERIVARLRRSPEHRVVVVAAAAGYGKSVAVRQALTAGNAFYRVPPDTTTLLAFVRGLTGALESGVPGAHLSLSIAYERACQSASPARELARWLGDHLHGSSVRIVVDDLHNATAPEIPEFVRHGIAAAPPDVGWLLAVRDAAALPVASWLAERICDLPLSEAELGFTREEAGALAAAVVPPVSPARLASIVRLTDGWPSAVTLALSLGPVDLPDRAAEPLHTYRELARRAVDALTEPQRAEMLRSAVLPDIAATGDTASPFLDDLGNGRSRYDDLFRRYLLERLRDRGPEAEREALFAAGAAGERHGDVRAALAYYGAAGVPEAVGRILASDGVALTDGGFADVVEAAIAALDRDGYDGGPEVMLLKAIRDARLVRFDSAEAWFQLAIAASADASDLRLRIVHRYALDLLRRGRVDGIELLESAIASAPADHELQPLLCSTLATAYAIVDRLSEAGALIASAMTRLKPDLPDALRTRAFHQAAYVALRCARIAEARRYAERVLEIAVPNGFYDLAARAHSILYEIAHAWEAHPASARTHVESVADYALKSGDTHIRQWALLAAYYIEAECGNAAMMSTIERALNAAEVFQTTEETNATLLPGQALRATWSGDFANALRLARSAERPVSADRRALRWAEIALFGAAAGLLDEAREAVAAARAELDGRGAGKHGTQAIAYVLLALSLLGDRMTWITVHDAVRDMERDAPGSVFVRAAEVLHGHWYEKRDADRVFASLHDLRSCEFGGVAAMLEALPADPAVPSYTRT
jgi:ATP/maltotriose-dependent transcriptional regulator MalT